jgi:hypothetical protein
MGRLKWNDNLLDQLRNNIAAACVGIGHAGEGLAKQNLWPGHGYETGAMQRSIHAAEPGYNFGQDNVEPGPGTPERGGQAFEPRVKKRKVAFALGSGQKYAIWQHEGTRRFSGVKFITGIIPEWGRLAIDILRRSVGR